MAFAVTVATPATNAAAVDLGLGAEVAARYDLRFRAVGADSRATGNGEIVVRAATGVDLEEGLNVDLDLEADADFRFDGLNPNTRYTVVIAGLASSGSELAGTCEFETDSGGRSGLASAACATTIAGLASVSSVELFAGGEGGRLVARARVSASNGLDLGLGLGLGRGR